MRNEKAFDIGALHVFSKSVYEGYHGPEYGVVLLRRWNNEVISVLSVDWNSIDVFHLFCFRWGAEEVGKHTFVIGITPWFEVGVYDSVPWLSIGSLYYNGEGWHNANS